jgi:hypothetical protein
LTVEHLRVDLEQDVNCVSGPFGDLSRRHPGSKPGGDRRVPKAVGVEPR